MRDFSNRKVGLKWERNHYKRDMKVAFVTAEYPPNNIGGAGISSKLIVEGLRSRDLSIDVYSLTSNSPGLTVHSSTHHTLPANSYSFLPTELGENVSVLRNLPTLSNYDIVHCYNTGHLPATTLKVDPPVVGTINNHMWVCIDPVQYLKEDGPELSLRRMVRYARSSGYQGFSTVGRVGIEFIGRDLVKRADHLTVQTKGMRQVLERSGYVDKPISVVPNLVDPALIVDLQDSRDSAKKTLVFLGRLVEQKGVIDVLNAFTSLPLSVANDWRLRIYGNGPLESMVEELIEQQDDYDVSLEFTPYDQLVTVYEEADAMIHSSKYIEPFSRTWLEAMGTRTPIICSDNPSARCVLDGVAAMYDPFDEDDLYKTLLDVLTNQPKRNSMAAQGLERIENYNQDKILEQYLNIYNNILYD